MALAVTMSASNFLSGFDRASMFLRSYNEMRSFVDSNLADETAATSFACDRIIHEIYMIILGGLGNTLMKLTYG